MRQVVGALALAIPLVVGLPSPAAAMWRQRDFVIGGYAVGGDPASLIRIDRAGVWLVVSSEHHTPARARELVARLDSLHRAHPDFRVKTMVYQETGRPNALFKNPDPVANRAAILAELTPGAGLNSPSVEGWCLWDEPPLYYGPSRELTPVEAFRRIHELTRLIRDTTSNASSADKLPFVNLFPIQAFHFFRPACSPDTLRAYACYLDGYLSSFDADSHPAPLLSFDKYPFEVPWADFRLYFLQLAIIRDQAARYSRPRDTIPFWSVIQAAPRREKLSSPYFRMPTLNQIRWQAYVSVAYGAKGILYWTLRPLDISAAGQGYGASFLKRDGSSNGALYDSLTALNAELKALGPTLMTLEPVAVFHAAANRFVLPAGDDSLARAGSPSQLVARLEGRTPEGMAGSFRSSASAERYVMVANKDTLIAQSFRVTLRQPAGTVERISKRDGRRIPVATTSSTTFSTGVISPGGGELFRIVPR